MMDLLFFKDAYFSFQLHGGINIIGFMYNPLTIIHLVEKKSI